MMMYLLFLALLHLSSSLHTIATSNLQTTIITPGYFTSLANFHNIYQNQYTGSGSYWIWSNEADATPIGRTITFQSLFYLNCNGPVTLNITADSSFIAYLDGKFIGKGSNYVRIYSFLLDAKCGSHNLTIAVTKGSSTFGPGLNFAVFQDQSGCFNCKQNGEWSDDTCSCECVTACGCDYRKVWVAYPICGCICLETIPAVSLPKMDNQALLMQGIRLPTTVQLKALSCPSGQHYSQNACGCICDQRYCDNGFRWNSEPSVCDCERNQN